MHWCLHQTPLDWSWALLGRSLHSQRTWVFLVFLTPNLAGRIPLFFISFFPSLFPLLGLFVTVCDCFHEIINTLNHMDPKCFGF